MQVTKTDSGFIDDYCDDLFQTGLGSYQRFVLYFPVFLLSSSSDPCLFYMCECVLECVGEMVNNLLLISLDFHLNSVSVFLSPSLTFLSAYSGG